MISQLVIEQAALEERARRDRIARAWEYYYGRLPKPLKVRKGEPDDNLALNFARPIVDKGVAFLFGQDIAFGLDASDDSEAAGYLAACWRRNGLMSLLSRIATNGGVTGHAFL